MLQICVACWWLIIERNPSACTDDDDDNNDDANLFIFPLWKSDIDAKWFI